MNNKKIQNQKTEVPTGIELNDKDYMNSLLSTLKEMTKNYATFLTETSNEYLYEEIKKFFDDTLELQRETYELMFQNGWYVLEEAGEQKVNEKYNMLNQEFDDLYAESEDDEELEDNDDDESEEYENEDDSDDEEESNDDEEDEE